MKVNDYQAEAARTAVYPGRLTYPTLGLCGEVGELIEVLINDLDQGACGDELDNIVKETGDVLWYVANVAKDMNASLAAVMGRDRFKVCDTKWYPDGVIRQLPLYAGKAAEMVKKSLRDDGGLVTNARYVQVASALCHVVVWLERLCSWYGVTLEECAQLNLDKLRDRAERGVIKGDGDNR